MTWVKSFNPDHTVTYFRSIEECCKVFNIKYHQTLVRLVEKGQLAEDGKTFFDYPTKQEIRIIERMLERTQGHMLSITEDSLKIGELYEE